MPGLVCNTHVSAIPANNACYNGTFNKCFKSQDVYKQFYELVLQPGASRTAAMRTRVRIACASGSLNSKTRKSPTGSPRGCGGPSKGVGSATVVRDFGQDQIQWSGPSIFREISLRPSQPIPDLIRGRRKSAVLDEAFSVSLTTSAFNRSGPGLEAEAERLSLAAEALWPAE